MGCGLGYSTLGLALLVNIGIKFLEWLIDERKRNRNKDTWGWYF